MIEKSTRGNDRYMPTTSRETLTSDEELGSPVFSFEKGWLAGLVLGTSVILMALRRSQRQVRARAADD
jgi:hypothetical protein